MTYEPQKFDNLLGTAGFSDQLLNNHFTLYNGYVTNTNKLIELLKTTDKTSPMYAELKRRFGWEYNGMKLHELYFGNMKKGGTQLDSKSKLAKEITKQFGSFDDWKKDFITTGTMRGIGWVILVRDEKGNMFNTWINEHDIGHLAGATPVLVMDVFEHAFMVDYGLKRADYITAFFNAIDWEEAAKR